MADISKIKLPNNSEYNFKDSGAIRKNETGNTQQLVRPSYLRGANDNTLDAKINTLRANRLAFLPADQIIIEKTVDGGTTWTDAGIPDSTKVGLFSETRTGIYVPMINGVRSMLCGIRITFTAMKYNVPSGTAETQKYNYWNSNYIASTERYNQLKEMYFWVSTVSDTLGVKVERATGKNSTNWVTIFNDSTFLMTGWSGNDYLRFSQNVFGGGTTQTDNYWNYRITFMTKGTTASNGTELATYSTTSAQAIMEIRGYGDTWWTAGNEYAANDKMFTHDYLKNVTFPNKVTATGGFVGNVTGNVSGTASNVTGTVAVANGGTGATSAANARTNLGLGTAAVANLSTATNSTSTTTAATSSAVKTAYDLANTALSGVNGTLIYDHTYSISNGVATFTAHVYQKGVEVTSNYADSCFEWSYKLANAVTGTPSVVSLGTGKTKTITISTLGYGGYVLGTFTPPA